VITGFQEVEKSSLAFDTIYAEGQRRHRTFSALRTNIFRWAWNALNVDIIRRTFTSYAIEQKPPQNPEIYRLVRITEDFYDFLRPIICPERWRPIAIIPANKMVVYTNDQIRELIKVEYLL